MIYPTARDNILNAAKNRFGHYGFKKTSMAEIAKDCDMSAANIYRHFSGKDDIIAALTTDIFAEEEKQLAKLCATDFPDSSSKLHSFFMEALVQSHRYVTKKPRMKEMVDYICQERIDLINANTDAKLEFIESILQEGINNHEFFIEDIEKTAKAIKSATVMFHTPLFFDLCTIDILMSSCTNVVDILITAITRHPKESTCKK